jgi:hypothetical protein
MAKDDGKFRVQLAKVSSRLTVAKKSSKTLDDDLKKMDKLLLQIKSSSSNEKTDFEKA